MRDFIYDYEIKFCCCVQKAAYFPTMFSKKNLCKNTITEKLPDFDNIDLVWMPIFEAYQPTFKTHFLNACLLRAKFFKCSYTTNEELLNDLFNEFNSWIQYVFKNHKNKDFLHKPKISLVYNFFLEKYNTINFTSNFKATTFYLNPFITYWLDRGDLIDCLHLKKNILILPLLFTWDEFIKFKENLKIKS